MLESARRCCNSLFTRLALVLLAMVLLINCGTWLLYIRSHSWGDTADSRHMARYARFLAEALGSPPDPARAETLAAGLPLRITVSGPGGFTVGQDGEFPETALTLRPLAQGVWGGLAHGYRRMVVAGGDGTVLTFDSFPTDDQRRGFVRFAILSLTLTWAAVLAAYVFMRRLLRPVRRLSLAAAAVRDGDLDRRVPEAGGGELQELSRTFNEMADALRAMLCSRERLLLDVGHELRTPITRLKLALEMLTDRGQALALRQDVDELEAMVTSILESARLRRDAGTARLAVADLAALAASVASRYTACGPGLVLSLPGNPVALAVDAEKVASLVRNLLDNACKYARPADPPVELRLAVEAGAAVLAVIDHGPGVPAQALARIFEPFYRVDASRTRATGGYGLGLSLCQAIAKAHGGRIEAASTPGGGLTVTVFFPVRTSSSTNAAP